MSDVLRATYADLKTVKTRSTCQLILELPIEALTDVVALLGAPVPGNEVWVAVARLREAAEPAAGSEKHKTTSLAQIAGILCNEGAFKTFMRREKGYSQDTAEAVRLYCGVDSRADLDRNPEAAAVFRDLRGDYDAWVRCAA